MAAEKITPIGAIGSLIILLLLWNAGFFDQVTDSTQDIAERSIDSGKSLAESSQHLTEQTIDDLPIYLEAGKTACNIDEIVVDKILTTGIHSGMYNNVGWTELKILNKWNNTGIINACEIAILDDLFPEDSTGNVWRNQLGIKNAMKNVSACTIIDCIDEYDLIEIHE